MTESDNSRSCSSADEEGFGDINNYQAEVPWADSENHSSEEEEEEGPDEYSSAAESEAQEEQYTQVSCAEPRPKTAAILDNYSSEIRFRILQNELHVLKTERCTWSEREQDLLDRLQASREALRQLKKKLIDSQKVSQTLEQEIELIKIRSKIRHDSLESSYRKLCDNVRLSEEASLRLRLEHRRLQTKNLVLEELLKSKGSVHDKLEAKMKRLMESVTSGSIDKQETPVEPSVSAELESKKMGLSAQNEGTAPNIGRGEDTENSIITMATARESNTTQSEESSNSDAADLKDVMVDSSDIEEGGSSDSDSDPDKVDLAGSNSSSQGVAQSTTSNRIGPAGVTKIAALIENHLKQMISCSKETERQMRQIVDTQIEELKEMLVQTRAELAYKTEECHKLSRSLENLQGELDIAKSKVDDGLQQESQMKSHFEAKLIEMESMQNELQNIEMQYEQAKRELEASMLREKQNKAVYDEYVRETDAKLFKMELLVANSEHAVGVKEGNTALTPDQKTKEPNSMGDSQYVSIPKSEYDELLLRSKKDEPKVRTQPKLKGDGIYLIPQASQTQIITPEEPKPLPIYDINLPPYSGHKTADGYVKVTQEYMMKLLKKEALLMDKLKAEVVRSYSLDKRLKSLEKCKKPSCVCKKSLKHAKATKTRRCWCRYKRLAQLKRNIASSALKRDAKAIAEVMNAQGATKKQKAEKHV